MLLIKYFRIKLFDFYSSVGLWNFKESSRLKGALARNKMKDKSEKGTKYQFVEISNQMALNGEV